MTGLVLPPIPPRWVRYNCFDKWLAVQKTYTEELDNWVTRGIWPSALMAAVLNNDLCTTMNLAASDKLEEIRKLTDLVYSTMPVAASSPSWNWHKMGNKGRAEVLDRSFPNCPNCHDHRNP